MVVGLKPLHDLYNIKMLVASTYQSVSGVGKAGIMAPATDPMDFESRQNAYEMAMIRFLISEM